MIEIIGIGFRATATLDDFDSLEAQFPAHGARVLALPAFRAGLPLALHLQAMRRPLIWIPRAVLRGQPTPSQSPRSLAHYATGSVAEACALLALPQARLLDPARLSPDHMITAARAIAPFDPSAERPFA